MTQLLNANPPRRFLEKSSATAGDDNAGQWVEVPLKRTVTKTSQALRDTARDGRAKQKERGTAINNGGGAHNLQSFQQQQPPPREQQLTALSKDGSTNNINLAAAASIDASGMTASHQSLQQGIPFSPIVPSSLTSANNNQQVGQDEGGAVLLGPQISMKGGDDGAAMNIFGQKFGEGIENELLDNFLDDFGSGLLDDIDDIVDSAPIGIDDIVGGVENQSVVAVALTDWILKEFACKGGCGSDGQLTMSAYLNSALSIAIKLTEVANDFPLESILLKNVFVAPSSAVQLGIMNALPQQQEDDFPVVIRCQPSLSGSRGGGDGDGTINDRLFAVGKILVPLFSGAVDGVCYDDSKRSSSPTIDSINLNSSERLAKRKQAKPSPHVSAQLERLDLPPPVKTILSDLLECGQGEFVGDEAYTSFGDLLVDLKLLKKAGLSRFLQSPSIEVCDKICGRDKEIEALNASYRNNPNTQGILIMGTGGVGKSGGREKTSASAHARARLPFRW